MDKQESAKILKEHNEWRRYKGDADKSPPMVYGKKLGEAIEAAVKFLEADNVDVTADYLSVARSKVASLIKQDHFNKILSINNERVVLSFEDSTCTVDSWGRVEWVDNA